MNREITHVAVKTSTKIWALPKPMRHHHVLRLMTANAAHDYGNEVEGFLDDSGHFLTRSEGYVLATSTGQIDRTKHPVNSYDGNELFSEDLW